MKGRLYERWKEGNEDYMEDGIKGGMIKWKMERREGRLCVRWNEWRKDYMEDGMKERKNI